MTQAVSKSDQLLADILAAAREQPPHTPAAEDVGDYDWNTPSRFTTAQMKNMEQFTERVGKEISTALSEKLREEVVLKPGAPGQYYAERIPLLEEEAANHCAGLESAGGESFGLVAIPSGRTLEWVAKVLGGSSDDEAERELSSLESALLRDILASITRGFSDAFEQVGGERIRCGSEISTTPELPGTGPTDDYLLLSFQAGDENEQAAITFVLTSKLMVPVAGASVRGKQTDKSPEKYRKDILTCLENVPVTTEVILGAIDLTMRGLMNLEEGDVLLINRKADEPVELFVQGKAILSGYPVRSEERYALKFVSYFDASGMDGA